MLFLASTPKGDDDQDWYSITMADPTWWCGSMLGPVSGHSSLNPVNRFDRDDHHHEESNDDEIISMIVI